MRCDDGVWSSIYTSWLEAKVKEDPSYNSGPVKTGDHQIDQIEDQFYKKFVLKEN